MTNINELNNNTMLNLKQPIIKSSLITDELNDIINGYIMSDGHVTKYGSLCVQQSKKQEKFVHWLYAKLKPLCSDNVIQEVTMTDKRTNSKTYSCKFVTKSILKDYRTMWYTSYIDDKGILKYKKVLPKNMSALFNSTFVTIWFAGDGTKIIGSKGAKFEVTSFSPEERHILKNLFEDKFDIKAVINRAGFSNSGTQQWTLNIRSKEYAKFYALITKIDLIPSIFPHKLHKKP